MEIIEFEKFNNHLKESFYSQDNENTLRQARFVKFVLEANILNTLLADEHFFYPKNMWKEDADLEIYFFTKDKLVVCSSGDVEKVVVTKYSLADITKNELIFSNHQHNECEMKITFSNEDCFTFSSNDTNESWRSKYYEAIVGLYKKLS